MSPDNWCSFASMGRFSDQRTHGAGAVDEANLRVSRTGRRRHGLGDRAMPAFRCACPLPAVRGHVVVEELCRIQGFRRPLTGIDRGVESC